MASAHACAAAPQISATVPPANQTRAKGGKCQSAAEERHAFQGCDPSCGLTLEQADHHKVSLVVDSVGAQFFQDSDLPIGTTLARIPTYTVLDLSGDYTVDRYWRLLGGVSNLLNRRYYSRVFLTRGGIEPALSIAGYAGVAYDFGR